MKKKKDIKNTLYHNYALIVQAHWRAEQLRDRSVTRVLQKCWFS